MNRQERRRNARKINTPQKLEELVGLALKKQRQDLTAQFKKEKGDLVNVMIVMTAYVLNYKLGLGKKRLPEIIDSILFNIDAFVTNHLTPEDFVEIREEVKKLGVNVK